MHDALLAYLPYKRRDPYKDLTTNTQIKSQPEAFPFLCWIQNNVSTCSFKEISQDERRKKIGFNVIATFDVHFAFDMMDDWGLSSSIQMLLAVFKRVYSLFIRWNISSPLCLCEYLMSYTLPAGFYPYPGHQKDNKTTLWLLFYFQISTGNLMDWCKC